MLNAFAVVALLAAAFGIVNTLLMSVQERTREIGLMKAMGMSNGRVIRSLQSGGSIHRLPRQRPSASSSRSWSDSHQRGPRRRPLSGLAGLHLLMFQPASIVGVIVLIVVIAFLAGTLPAWRGARKTPIDALRYE